ncbi:MAG: type II 3-dehydroquinate dehydratase [Gammaproteobacteria bacterium]|nr:MAG: type II 3-dehydroquinate dehydratase [Gammaproteobacteria bacterium]
MARILLVNGPNLNLLGVREPKIYGYATLAEIEEKLHKMAVDAGHKLETLQSNAEHEIVEFIQKAVTEKDISFIIINPAAFTHTSVAIRDALLSAATPFIELHISNVHSREAFRNKSYLSDIALGVICGLGPQGYELAMQAALANIQE